MRYEETFIAGFRDEMEKQALIGAALRAVPAIARAAGGWLAKKAPGAFAKTKSFVKNAPKKSWNVMKKNPMSTAMVGQAALTPRPKVAKIPNTAPEYVQKVAGLL